VTEVPPEEQRPDQEPQEAAPEGDVPVEDAAADEGEVVEQQAEPDPPADAPAQPESSAEDTTAGGADEGDSADDEPDYLDESPRERPAIPGADLEPDIILEGQDTIYPEEGEELGDPDADTTPGEDEDAPDEPIAVSIDLAAGARYPDKGYVVGKRKSAVARVFLAAGSGEFRITSADSSRTRSLEDFFPRHTLQKTIRHPLEAVGFETQLDVVARMHGGGVSAQADALRHGIARALLEADPNLRGELKRRGFLTRDARVKERKKAGLKKARKRPQFSKR
jgi:small subunit ribosomal protein S9